MLRIGVFRLIPKFTPQNRGFLCVLLGASRSVGPPPKSSPINQEAEQERLHTREMLLQESEDAIGIIRSNHWFDPLAQVENEGLLLLESVQIQR
jgi:hypothetical protein